MPSVRNTVCFGTSRFQEVFFLYPKVYCFVVQNMCLDLYMLQCPHWLPVGLHIPFWTLKLGDAFCHGSCRQSAQESPCVSWPQQPTARFLSPYFTPVFQSFIFSWNRMINLTTVLSRCDGSKCYQRNQNGLKNTVPKCVILNFLVYFWGSKCSWLSWIVPSLQYILLLIGVACNVTEIAPTSIT